MHAIHTLVARPAIVLVLYLIEIGKNVKASRIVLIKLAVIKSFEREMCREVCINTPAINGMMSLTKGICFQK
jgi:hypothetical protein